MIRILSVFTSPLQLLNVIEYLKFIGSDLNECRFISLQTTQSTKVNHKPLSEMCSYFGIGEMRTVIQYRGSALLGEISRVQTISRLWKFCDASIETVVVGEFRSLAMMSLSSKCSGGITVVDDGNASVANIEKFLDDKIYRWMSYSTRGKVGRLYQEFLIKNFVSADLCDRLQFFSAFSVGKNLDSVTNNKYSFARSLCGHKYEGRAEAVLVVGSWYSEAGVLSLKDEVDFHTKLCEMLKKTHATMQVWYVSHRMDSSSKKDTLKLLYDNVISLSLPVELFPVELNVSVRRIVSSYSTALVTLKSIYASDVLVDYIRFPEAVISEKYKQEVFEIYDYMKEVGIRECSFD